MKTGKIRIIFGILLLAILSFFLWQKVSPPGSWSCRSLFNSSFQFFIGRGCFSTPSPSDRTVDGDELKMIGDPLYFSLYSPRHFDKLKIILIFRPKLEENIPVIEAGLLADKNLWRYQLQPVYNYWLENLTTDWEKVEGDNWSLWQESATFTEIDDFLNILETKPGKICGILPISNCLAVYNLPATKNFQLPLIAPMDLSSAKDIKLDLALRGRHSFFIHLLEPDLNLSLSLEHLKSEMDWSPINLAIYSGNQSVFNSTWEDEHIKQDMDLGKHSRVFPLEINLPALPAGLYRVEININEDTLIRELSVRSAILSFREKIWPHLDYRETIRLFSDSPYLQIKITDPAARQTIDFSGQKFILDELYKQIEIAVLPNFEKEVHELSLSQGGVLIEGPGVFSWAPEDLFNPEYSRLNRFYDRQAKFILADYRPAEHLDHGWLKAEIEFDLAGIYREKDKYNFIISVPGLRAEDGSGNLVEIKEIRAWFSGRTLKEKLISVFNF